MAVPGTVEVTLDRQLIHGTVPITEVTMIAGEIHGAIHITDQVGPAPLAITGEVHGTMDGV